MSQDPFRAAQYVRMSTDHQKYSTANQAEVIAAYARGRNIDIVRTYADEGLSGLGIGWRDGLKTLIADVEGGRCDFNSILVYDVSRWGRFQDVDESAYYEFLCKKAGVTVHYCAEQFENDGSVAAAIIKNVKRAMAGEYSRELSTKVFAGQCRISRLGYKCGGVAGFGLRRWLVDEQGRTKVCLESGQHKFLHTDRVVLRQGPPEEVETIRWIFGAFVLRNWSASAIARELNAQGIRAPRGKPWRPGTIISLLSNERYVGNLVFNRRSFKLQQRMVKNPRELWVRCNDAIEPIITPDVFAKAQAIQVNRGRRPRHLLSDQQILERLTALLKREGKLSEEIIQRAKDVPAPLTIIGRFGSLVAAYDLIGFNLPDRYRRNDRKAQVCSTIDVVVQELTVELERRGARVSWNQGTMVVNCNAVSICVARATNYAGCKCWRLCWASRKAKSAQANLTIIIRMDDTNQKASDYLLLPSVKIAEKSDRILRVFSRFFAAPDLVTSPGSVAAKIILRTSVRASVTQGADWIGG